MRTAANSWVRPLAIALTAQVVSSFLVRIVPTLAPLLAVQIRWSEAAVGLLSAVCTLGSIVFLMGGNPIVRAIGSVRSLQVGLLIGAAGTFMLLMPWGAAAVVASLVIGLGFGPAMPASSDILHRYAPAGYRSLVFSIKQAGTPAGGVLAGLIMPYLVDRIGWQATLVAAVVFALGIAISIRLMHQAADAWPSGLQRPQLRAVISPGNLAQPVRSLWSSDELARISLAGCVLALCQGAWFAYLATYLVVEIKLSLTSAGALFAIMQGTGIVGRMLLGWGADRTGSRKRMMQALALASAATTFVLGCTTPEWPFAALVVLATVAGFTVTSWNGVQVAEVVRLAPPELIHEAASGATILVFVGSISGPLIYAVTAQLVGSLATGYMAIAAVSLLGIPIIGLKQAR